MKRIPLTTKGVADVLGVTPETVRRLNRTGKLTARRTSTNFRLFDPGGVQRLARERQAQRAAAKRK
jgi:excisionase family DNA binding protein